MKNVFRCKVCGRFTEDGFHCGQKAELVLDAYRRTRLSKLLSALLRHIPHEIGLKMDEEGFVSIEELVEKIKTNWKNKEAYRWLQPVHVLAVVETCPKGRFEVKNGKIRARYGHSVNVRLELAENSEVKVLYHGTSRERLNSILREGLKPMQRKFVHLSATVEEAFEVGRRKGKNVVVLKVDVEKLRRAGYKVWRAGKSVYVAKYVPPNCLEVLS